jgi:hypothetical protein
VLLPQSCHKQVTALLAIAWQAEEAHCQNIVPDGIAHVKYVLNLLRNYCTKDANKIIYSLRISG